MFDLSAVEAMWHSAAPCPQWLKGRWIDLLGPDRVFESNGGTEGQTVTVITGAEWMPHKGSVGRPVVGEIQILDCEGRLVAPGKVGEIFLRRSADSPPAYHYIGAVTHTRAGGWDSLGDLGWFDEDGYLYLTDRRSDMILVGGANV
ncbi:AMP-binding protein [Nocardia sp. NPDC057030]|uniref:AMP-binding protein n=1 Tax=unclassified Nocardia TaxID=2637762 RepID=UPI0036416F64